MGQGTDAKLEFLRSRNSLHPHPPHVRDPLFADSEFFDPRDLVQVRYEMLRRHRVEGRPVSQVARSFGVSRQLFYLVEKAFARQGIHGLLPRKRGPKQARKCSWQVVQFVAAGRALHPPAPWKELAADVQRRFGIQLHPRTLQRAWSSRKKGAKRRTVSRGIRPAKRKRQSPRRSATRTSAAQR